MDHYADDPCRIPILIDPKLIVFLDEIMEGYSHLGFVTTIDGKKGLTMLQVTDGTKPEVMQILKNFPHDLKILSAQEANEILASE